MQCFGINQRATQWYVPPFPPQLTANVIASVPPAMQRERESNTVAGWFAPQALSASEVLDAKECFEILGKGASTVEVRGRCIVPCPNRCLTLCAARARIAP